MLGADTPPIVGLHFLLFWKQRGQGSFVETDIEEKKTYKKKKKKKKKLERRTTVRERVVGKGVELQIDAPFVCSFFCRFCPVAP